jgi:hypothetical protein
MFEEQQSKFDKQIFTWQQIIYFLHSKQKLIADLEANNIYSFQ